MLSLMRTDELADDDRKNESGMDSEKCAVAVAAVPIQHFAEAMAAGSVAGFPGMKSCLKNSAPEVYRGIPLAAHASLLMSARACHSDHKGVHHLDPAGYYQ